MLDEPASGLDPLQSANIRALIRELGKDRAVILSTHLIADVNQCCDRVAILHRGRLRYDGPVQMMSNDQIIEVRDWLPDYPGQSGEQKAQDLRATREYDAHSAPLSEKPKE